MLRSFSKKRQLSYVLYNNLNAVEKKRVKCMKLILLTPNITRFVICNQIDNTVDCMSKIIARNSG